MKITKSLCTFLIFLLVFAVIPFWVVQVKAQNTNDGLGQPQVSNIGQWWQINDSAITVLVPVQGQKPMFLWYYNDNSSEVYCVNYQGLVEYLPLNGYYTPDCEANPQTMQDLMISQYGGMGGMGMSGIQGEIGNAYQSWVSDFHPSYLPFSACSWLLTGPSQGIDENGNAYVSFNFTLSGAPTGFGFAQNNVSFACTFYENQTTQQPFGLYSYSLGPNQLEMDMTINNWSWNSNYMSSFFMNMHNNYGVSVSSQNDSLALWCDFTSISMQDLGVAANYANEPLTSVPQNSTLAPTSSLETSSTMSGMIAGNQQINLQNMPISTTSPLSISTTSDQSFRMQFAENGKTLPGFFDYANKAAIVNPTTGQASAADATASYRTTSTYMQLFICYPYFGANTLVHDPSIGIDTNAQIIPENPSVLFPVAALAIIALALAVTRKKIKNSRRINQR